MKITKNNKFLLLLPLFFLFLTVSTGNASAESEIEGIFNEPLMNARASADSDTGGHYQIDYPTLEPNEVYLGEPQPVYVFSDLVQKMATPGPGSYYLMHDLTIPDNEKNPIVTVVGEKELDLNGKTLDAGANGAFNLKKSGSQYFKLKNGDIINGRGKDGKQVGTGNKRLETGFIYVPNENVDSQLVFEDITHTNKTGGGFVKALASDMFFYGNVRLENGYFNIRGGSLAFYGDFFGSVEDLGRTNYYPNETGAVNISFQAQEDNIRRTNHNQFYGDRRMYVAKESDVNLISKAKADKAYSNVVGNFATLVVDGKFEATSWAPPLRSTASWGNTKDGYVKSAAGTYNSMANINVNKDAKFKITSTTTEGNMGALYTFSTNIFAYDPEIFDMRYFGVGNFFFSWDWQKPFSNMKLYDMDVAVWDKESKGAGNPKEGGIWQDVAKLEVTDFTDKKGSGDVSATPASLGINKNTFDIASYSRISNDVLLPIIIPDAKFTLGPKQFRVDNGADKFFGKADYKYPDGSIAGKAIPNTEVTLTHGGTIKARTTTDANGNWSFDNFKSLRLSANDVIKLNLTDEDKRYAEEVVVQIKDTLGPDVKTKLQRIQQNTLNALTDPKLALSSYSDETASQSQLKVEFLTTPEQRQEMVKTVGFHKVKVRVTDPSGNPTDVEAPVIVYDPPNPPTNGFAVGKNFEVDFDKWTKASDDGKRQIMIDENYGAVKGYEITGDTVTEVTNDPSKLTMNFSGFNWEPKKTYTIDVKVGTFKTPVKVTLVPAAVKVNPKQVYKDTDTAIFKDLSSNAAVDNTKQYDVKIGDPLSQVITDLIDNGNITLNYTGYNPIEKTNYKVKVNNQIIETDKVPDTSFELIFEYVGQMKFQQAPNLDFGKVEISKDSTQSELAANSQDEVEIINTLLRYDWTLKASIPKGIKSDGAKEEFIGQLLYYDEDGSKHVIDKAGTKLTAQKATDKSLSTVNVRGTNKSGMRLEQHIGNNKDKYSGELEWSLEDVPK